MHNTTENSANIRQYYFWIFFVLHQNFQFLNSSTLNAGKFDMIFVRRTKIGWCLSRTTNKKNTNLTSLRHMRFDSLMPSRKRIIRTRHKRRNFGIFRLVVFARHKALLHPSHQNLLKISSVSGLWIFRKRIFGYARQKHREYFVYSRVF